MMIPADEPTPLAILLQIMRDKWAEGDRKGAAAAARIAAPYLHPRRAAVTHSGHIDLEVHRLSDAEIANRLTDTETREGAPPEAPRLLR